MLYIHMYISKYFWRYIFKYTHIKMCAMDTVYICIYIYNIYIFTNVWYIYISLSLFLMLRPTISPKVVLWGTAPWLSSLENVLTPCTRTFPLQSVSVLFDHRVWFFEPHWEDSHRSHKEVPEDSNSSPLEIQEGRG